MISSPDVFNMSHVARFVRRTNADFLSYDFLYQKVVQDIRDRLDDITRKFNSVLLCGEHTGQYFLDVFPDAVVMDIVLPEKFSSYIGQFDLIISLGHLHRANDFPGVLIQMRRALKSDGVLMAAFAGGETLHQLRASLMQAEIEVLGGASPRIFPFVDTQHMAGLMQRAGFALPVVDSEIFSVSYRDMFHLMEDVRGMGESNSLMAKYRAFTPSRVFAHAAEFYRKNYGEGDAQDNQRVMANFEIIHAIGWAPHESQQKPAKRGSGQVSLTEIL